MFATAELCDRLAGSGHLQIAEPLFRHFGGKQRFAGRISTLKVFEDNALLRSVLQEQGQGRVLVIDGGGSRRCALMGDTLTALAVEQGWEGILVYGCVRGVEAMQQLLIGVMALNTHPLSSRKHGQGERDVMITFAGVNFKKDQFLYADQDGIVVADAKID